MSSSSDLCEENEKSKRIQQKSSRKRSKRYRTNAQKEVHIFNEHDYNLLNESIQVEAAKPVFNLLEEMCKLNHSPVASLPPVNLIKKK